MPYRRSLFAGNRRGTVAWSAEKYANSELNGRELASYAEEFEVCHRSYGFREMGSRATQHCASLSAQGFHISMARVYSEGPSSFEERF